MKWMSILLISCLIGCTTAPKPCKTLGKKCERSIKKVGDDCFEIYVNRANLNKINKGSACLNTTMETIETTDGWSNLEYGLSIGLTAAVFFIGGGVVVHQWGK